MRRIQRTNNRLSMFGFTIVELTIVVVVLGLIFPIFSALVVTSYRDVLAQDDRVKMVSELKRALWYMDDNVRVSNSFIAGVPSVYSDPYGQRNLGSSGGEAWSYKGLSSSQRVLMTQSYATTTNALSSGRQAVFVNTPEFNCTTEMYYQPQLSFVTIYFVNDGTLYRRLLTDTTTALCPGNAQQQRQTCPPYIAIGSRHASCLANDEILATNVTSFSVGYYQIIQDGTSTQIDPSFTSTDPEILSSADYALVTVTSGVRNNAVTSTLTQRLTKVNQL